MGVTYGIIDPIRVPFISYQRFKNYFDKLKHQDPILFMDLFKEIKYGEDSICASFCRGEIIHITCNNHFSFGIYIPCIIRSPFCEFDTWKTNSSINDSMIWNLSIYDTLFIKTLLKINFFQIKLTECHKINEFKIVAKVPSISQTMTRGLIGYIKNNESVCFPIFHDAYPADLGQKFIDLIEDEIQHHYFIENLHVLIEINYSENILHEVINIDHLSNKSVFDYIYVYDIDNREIVFGKSTYDFNLRRYRYSRISIKNCIKNKFIASLIFNFEPVNLTYKKD